MAITAIVTECIDALLQNLLLQISTRVCVCVWGGGGGDYNKKRCQLF